MQKAPLRRPHSVLQDIERTRRKRELLIIAIIMAIVVLLTVLESRLINFGSAIPVSNTILMFILININLLLLILLIFLVFRNLVKLFYDRHRRVMGATLRTRLVITFIALTLLPTTVLFFFSINFITTSIAFWFNLPVEAALENSLQIGRGLYLQAERGSEFFIERIAYQIKNRKLLDPKKQNELISYVQVVQREFNFGAVEIYAANGERLVISVTQGIDEQSLEKLPAAQLRFESSLRTTRSITGTLGRNEYVRTVGPVPLEARGAAIEGYLALTVLMDAGLSERLATVNRGFEEYQQFKLLKSPVQATYYITLSVVALLVVFCAVWFGFYLAKSITIPILELVEATRRVAEGDLEVRLAPRADDEIGSLVASFNTMTHDLQSSRSELERSARLLAEQNSENERRRRYIEIVLKNVSTGVITVDAQGAITTVNTAASRMLQLQANRVLGRNYRNLLGERHLRLAQEVTTRLADSGGESVELTLRTTVAGQVRSFLVSAAALEDEAGQRLGIVTVFDDLTELEKAQRMAAWREVARRIAHEVKNPLTPISLSAQRLQRRYAQRLQEPVFEECIHMIIDHVELIRNLVNEFSAFARFPAAKPRPCELLPIVEETVALYREGHEQVRFTIEAPQALPVLNLDRQQIKQALINLVDNAVAAIHGEGQVVIALRHDAARQRVAIEVADDGEGISEEVKARMFEPNFSTKTAGMGLGLTIVSTIVADHQGQVRVLDNQPRGARFVIDLPV